MNKYHYVLFLIFLNNSGEKIHKERLPNQKLSAGVNFMSRIERISLHSS